jgi:excinuclease UvrABC ATPase subunit
MREQHDHDDGNAVADAKRRLTVFTGASGSAKSSLVFGTIAAESPRPEVDVLDGLTPAIIVDRQRMGVDARSTAGTATDAYAMLRILFSRLRPAHDAEVDARG